MIPPHAQVEAAGTAIAGADALLFTAGAGMGVDSGLPDFRGDEGFWNAYPPYRHLGLSFVDMANPHWFDRSPDLAWGFYGHRLELYRKTTPHAGFGILKRWAGEKPLGGFVFTSNVDGQFQRAGFDPEVICECHGAIDWLQCTHDCGVGVFSADPYRVTVDPETFRAEAPLPHCPRCGAMARPNVLMFGDGGWTDERTIAQERRLEQWLDLVQRRRAKLAIVECGAGTAVPTVRSFGERIGTDAKAMLIRINVREPAVPPGHLSLPMGARAALEAIDAWLRARE